MFSRGVPYVGRVAKTCVSVLNILPFKYRARAQAAIRRAAEEPGCGRRVRTHALAVAPTDRVTAWWGGLQETWRKTMGEMFGVPSRGGYCAVGQRRSCLCGMYARLALASPLSRFGAWIIGGGYLIQRVAHTTTTATFCTWAITVCAEQWLLSAYGRALPAEANARRRRVKWLDESGAAGRQPVLGTAAPYHCRGGRGRRGGGRGRRGYAHTTALRKRRGGEEEEKRPFATKYLYIYAAHLYARTRALTLHRGGRENLPHLVSDMFHVRIYRRVVGGLGKHRAVNLCSPINGMLFCRSVIFLVRVGRVKTCSTSAA